MAERRHLTIVLTILADLGDKALGGPIRRFRDDPDPQVTEAAKQALRVLAHQSGQYSSPAATRLPQQADLALWKGGLVRVVRNRPMTIQIGSACVGP